MAHFEKSVSMKQHFEQFVGKQRRVELKSVGNFVAKTVLVESANQFSLEELCRTQYSLKYFFRSHVDHQTYGKTLIFNMDHMCISGNEPSSVIIHKPTNYLQQLYNQKNAFRNL